MTLEDIVNEFNRKSVFFGKATVDSPGTFKRPYSIEDFGRFSAEEEMLLQQDIDDGHLGWGYLKIGKDCVLGPPGVHVQPWIPKEYSQEAVKRFWEETVGGGYLVDNTSVNNAVDILVPRGLIKYNSLEVEANNGVFNVVEFNKNSNEPITIMNGYSRLHAGQSLLLLLQDSAGDLEIDYVLWLASFYDKGSRTTCKAKFTQNRVADYINGHPRAQEMKYMMVHW